MRSYPVTMIDNPVWDLSADRAQTVRAMLESARDRYGADSRVSGHADRKPVTADPTAISNNRIEVVLLRKDR